MKGDAGGGSTAGRAVGSASIVIRKLFLFLVGRVLYTKYPLRGPYAGSGEIVVSISNVGTMEMTAENFGYAGEDQTLARVGSSSLCSLDGSFKKASARKQRWRKREFGFHSHSHSQSAPDSHYGRLLPGSSMSLILTLNALCFVWA